MVAMGVGKEDVSSLNIINIDMLGKRVGTDKGIYQEVSALYFNIDTSVS